MSPKLLQEGTQGTVSGIDIDQCQRANRGCGSQEIFQSRGFASGNLMHDATCADYCSAFFMQEGRRLSAENGFRGVLPSRFPDRISLNGFRDGADIRRFA